MLHHVPLLISHTIAGSQFEEPETDPTDKSPIIIPPAWDSQRQRMHLYSREVVASRVHGAARRGWLILGCVGNAAPSRK